jgi:hypothetical protein
MNMAHVAVGGVSTLVVVATANAAVSLSGTLSLRGFVGGQFGPNNPDGSGQSSFISYAIGSQGGSGSGSTGGGVGRAELNMNLTQVGAGTRLRAEGFARHEFNPSRNGFRREFTAIGTATASGGWSDLQLSISETVRFEISNASEAFVENESFGRFFDGTWVDVNPARLTTLFGGTITFDEGSTTSGVMTAGTYALDFWIGAFGTESLAQGAIANAIAPGWSNVGSRFATASLADWSITMTAIPAPGAAGLLVMASGLRLRRRR